MGKRFTELTAQVYQKLRVIGAPVVDTDAANKKYVDSGMASVSAEYQFATQTDVTGSRAVDTVYQNNNDFPIAVSVCLYLLVMAEDGGVVGSSTGDIFVSSLIDGDEYIGSILLHGNLNGLTVGSNGLATYGMSFFIVPAGYYYKIVASGNNDGFVPTVEAWIEYGGTGT